jgi:hypothetical protein
MIILAANLIGEYSKLLAQARAMLNTFAPIRGIRGRRESPVLETIDFGNRK